MPQASSFWRPLLTGRDAERARETAASIAAELARLDDPDLARLLAAWPTLPPHIRAALLALVQTAGT